MLSKDLFDLGATLFHLIANRTPFDENTPLRIVRHASLAAIEPTLPKQFEQAIDRLRRCRCRRCRRRRPRSARRFPHHRPSLSELSLLAAPVWHACVPPLPR